jgi:hypothetical protein
VNQIGLGTDMWLVPFDNITKVLEVCDMNPELHRVLADIRVITDLLLHRAPLFDLDCTDEDIDLALLPTHFPSAGSPTRHLLYNSALHFVYHYIRFGNCAAMHPDPHSLGALGRRASRKMHQPERRRLGVCWRQHCSRLDRNHTAHEGAQKPRYESSSQIWYHAHVPWRRLVSSFPQPGLICSNIRLVLPLSVYYA